MTDLALPSSPRTLARPLLVAALVAAGCPGDPEGGSATADPTATTSSGASGEATADATAGPGTTTSTTTPESTGPTTASPTTTTTTTTTTGTTTGDTESGTESAGATTTTTDACPPGGLGCTCLPGQVCDDGLVCAADLCEPLVPGECGDGIVDGGEACDDGADNGPGKACKADCTLNTCGDGDPGPGEACDDGNAVDGDGCEATCAWTPCAILWEEVLEEPMGATRHGRSVAVDSLGNLAVTAWENPGSGQERIPVMKFSPDGEPLWTEIPLALRSDGHDVVVTPDDGIIAIGLEWEGPFGEDLAARYDPDGDKIWQSLGIFAEPSSAWAGAMTPDGGLVLAGYRTQVSSYTPWLARLDPADAAVQWTRLGKPPGALSARTFDVAVDGAGNLFVTGIVKVDQGFERMLVQRLDPAGAHVWAITRANPDYGFAWGWGVAVTPSGDVAVAGEYFYGDGDGGKTGGDLWAGAFAAADGGLLWEDVHDGGPGKTYDRGTRVAVDAKGHISVVGYVHPAKALGIFRKYDGDGALLCDRVIDAAPGANTQLYGVAIAPGGFPVVTGYAEKHVYLAKLTP